MAFDQTCLEVRGSRTPQSAAICRLDMAPSSEFRTEIRIFELSGSQIVWDSHEKTR